jgi:transaldolase
MPIQALEHLCPLPNGGILGSVFHRLEVNVAIYLDSAIPDEARRAMGRGFVRGITTNPKLLALARRPPDELLRELCHICPGNVFYQLTAATVSERRAEARRFLLLNEELEQEDAQALNAWQQDLVQGKDSPYSSLGRVGLKIPASTENMSLVAEFTDQEVKVAVTAMFSLAQAYVACEAGATYLLPYVNRTTRLRGDGIAFVRELAQVCKATGSGTEVLAASVKSPQEAVQTLLAGAHHVSMPLSVLLDMGHDPLSEQAVAEFARASSQPRPQ